MTVIHWKDRLDDVIINTRKHRKTWISIAIELGISATTVRRRAVELGLGNKKHCPKVQMRKPENEEDLKIIGYAKAHPAANVREIAKALKIGEWRVRSALGSRSLRYDPGIEESVAANIPKDHGMNLSAGRSAERV